MDVPIEAIENENKTRVKKLVSDLHPADIAEILDELTKEQTQFVFPLLDLEKGADVLIELEDDVHKIFLKTLPSEDLAKKLINKMNSNDAANVISKLSDEAQKKVLSSIEDVEQTSDIVDLLGYDEEPAEGLMAKELVSVKTTWNILTCIK